MKTDSFTVFEEISIIKKRTGKRSKMKWKRMEWNHVFQSRNCQWRFSMIEMCAHFSSAFLSFSPIVVFVVAPLPIINIIKYWITYVMYKTIRICMVIGIGFFSNFKIDLSEILFKFRYNRENRKIFNFQLL